MEGHKYANTQFKVLEGEQRIIKNRICTNTGIRRLRPEREVASTKKGKMTVIPESLQHPESSRMKPVFL